MNTDSLVTCKRCSSNACYEQKGTEDITTWLCMGCGFSTSTNLVENSKLVDATLEASPELYKDLAFIDDSKNVWFPATITLPEKGMVFVDGTSVNDWKWAAVQVVEISTEEREKYPKDQNFKIDMNSVKYFGQNDFMDALDQIGFYNV